MSEKSPRTVEDVQAALAPFGIPVQELSADTSTAVLAAQALGTTVPAIVKSLLFYADDEPVLVLAPGDRKVDRAALAEYLGASKTRLAKPEEVLSVAGYAVGGVPPVAHAHPLRVFIDEAIFRLPLVYAAAGAPNAIFAIEPHRLKEVAGAESANITS